MTQTDQNNGVMQAIDRKTNADKRQLSICYVHEVKRKQQKQHITD